MFGSKGRAVRRRQEFVATYQFPHSLGHDLSVAYPHLLSLEPAFQGLRQWLRLHLAAPELLGMPSRAVDLLWHEFILHTVFYKEFCLGAYGHDLHHSPERSMNGQEAQVLNGEGMARTFGMACADDHIVDPTLGLPTLFTVDAALGLTDGQWWTFDCGTTNCSAAPPGRCLRHQVLPFAPRRLPQQFDPRTNRWTQDQFNPWLFAQAGEFRDGVHHHGDGHSPGGQPDMGHGDGGSSHEGHAHSGAPSPDGGSHEGVSHAADGAGPYSDSGGSGGYSDGGSGSSGGSSDSGSSSGGSDGGGSSCGGSSCGGSSCGGSS
ncbi:MAG TPA: hypothetical protein VHU85_07765 [Acidimicrobiales bacterium]|jgi:hypothetical protein|nr:hypothetical protein [Acidimicrobiales bacterium]